MIVCQLYRCKELLVKANHEWGHGRPSVVTTANWPANGSNSCACGDLPGQKLYCETYRRLVLYVVGTGFRNLTPGKTSRRSSVTWEDPPCHRQGDTRSPKN